MVKMTLNTRRFWNSQCSTHLQFELFILKIIPCGQALGESGRKKLPFKRKKPPADSGSRSSSHLSWPVGGKHSKCKVTAVRKCKLMSMIDLLTVSEREQYHWLTYEKVILGIRGRWHQGITLANIHPSIHYPRLSKVGSQLPMQPIPDIHLLATHHRRYPGVILTRSPTQLVGCSLVDIQGFSCLDNPLMLLPPGHISKVFFSLIACSFNHSLGSWEKLIPGPVHFASPVVSLAGAWSRGMSFKFCSFCSASCCKSLSVCMALSDSH